MSGLVTYNLGNVANQPKSQLQATQKIMTGPAVLETKKGVANSPRPHLKGFSGDYFGSAISTSTRPLVTRDLNNKLSTLGQNFKTSHFPLNSLNYNAPINSYMNPFSIGANNGINPYKLSQGYQFDNNAFIRHQQTLASHRPVYNNHQGQIMQGKRQKVNQLQAQILQQIAANQYHQSLQSYHNTLTRPLESHLRPVEEYTKLNNQGNNNNKGNINSQGSNNVLGNNNVQKPVNPHESLSKQTKAHSQNVSPVTYKPPLGSQFQQFGVQEDSFGPIPSSILGKLLFHSNKVNKLKSNCSISFLFLTFDSVVIICQIQRKLKLINNVLFSILQEALVPLVMHLSRREIPSYTTAAKLDT